MKWICKWESHNELPQNWQNDFESFGKPCFLQSMQGVILSSSFCMLKLLVLKFWEYEYLKVSFENKTFNLIQKPNERRNLKEWTGREVGKNHCMWRLYWLFLAAVVMNLKTSYKQYKQSERHKNPFKFIITSCELFEDLYLN